MKIKTVFARISLLFVLFIFAFCMDVEAVNDPADDPMHISDDVRIQLKLEETEFVIKEYHLDIISAFSMDLEVESAITSEEDCGPTYLVISDGDVKYRCSINPDGSGLTKRDRKYLIIDSCEMDAIQEIVEGNAIKKISPDIQIHCVYYMRNLITFEGAAIYYETDKGEFVYYSESTTGEYLMPLSAFYELADDVANNREEGNYAVIGEHGTLSNKLSNKWSMFNVNSETFDPYAEPPGENNQIALWISLCVGLFVAGIVAVVLVYRRKRRTIIE